MSKVFLLLGGNQGDRLQLIEEANQHIAQEVGKITHKSSIYESEAWGFEAEQSFFNQVIIVETNKAPQEVLDQVLDIETILGRRRSGTGYSSRTMDIDVLFYDQEEINTATLIVPHPRLHLRRFTLAPLVEIASEFQHPTFNKSLSTLLLECKDQGEVKIYRKQS